MSQIKHNSLFKYAERILHHLVQKCIGIVVKKCYGLKNALMFCSCFIVSRIVSCNKISTFLLEIKKKTTPFILHSFNLLGIKRDNKKNNKYDEKMSRCFVVVFFRQDNLFYDCKIKSIFRKFITFR